MSQIQAGLKDINIKNFEMLNGVGSRDQEEAKTSFEIDHRYKCPIVEPLHPDLVNSASIDGSKNRISKSIKLMG